MYATIAAVRAVPSVDPAVTDAQITAALGVARTLIDAYTGQWWEPTAATVVARAGADGLVLLPYRVVTVTAVRPVGSSTPVPAGAYTFTSADKPHQFDSVRLGPQRWADPLIVGAEPWSGGWSNLLGDVSGAQVEIDGTFGRTAGAEPVIADAAVALAVWRLTGGTLVPASGALGGDATPPSTDDEGNAVSITVDTRAALVRSLSTGLATVDAALAPHRHADTVRIG